MPRKERKWEAVSKVARPLLNRVSIIPQRFQWALMSLVRVNLPDPKNEDLWTHGTSIRDNILNYTKEYDQDFTVENKNILKIGCGPGRILVPMAAEGADAWGIDIASRNLKRAKKFANKQNVSVEVAKAEESIPFNQEFFFVYSFATFMHLPRRVVVKYLIESHNHLRSGGVGCFVFRNLDHPQSRESLKDNLEKQYTARVRYHTPDEVENYMKIAGFEDISIIRDDDNDPQLFAFGKKIDYK